MIWSVSDVREDREYRLELCQTGEGKRVFKLVESDEEKKSEDAFSRTSVIDNQLLIKRNLMVISQSVNLENGERFYVDPHGMWMTQSESDQVEGGVDSFDVTWETKKPPSIARK